MGTSKSFGQLGKRLNLRARTVEQRSQRAVRRAAIAASNEAISRTPVDTGRARGNWTAAVGAPFLGLVDVSGAGAGSAASDNNKSIVEKWKLNSGPIFLTNSLPYIVPLDNGSSDQAPKGMVGFAVKAAQRELKKTRLLG